MPTAYATLADLAITLPATAYNTVLATTQQSILDARNAYADSKLRARYRLPLATIPIDIKIAVVKMAAYDILCVRGYNPAAGADVNIRMNYDDAIKFFDDVERGRMHPVPDEQATTSEYDAPMVISKPRDGWEPGTADPQPDQSAFFPSWQRPINNGS